MLAVLMLISAMQTGSPNDAIYTDIERFGRLFTLSNGCARAGYEVDFAPGHDMQQRIESRAAESGIPAAELLQRMNDSVVRHEAELPPRDLPEGATPLQFVQHFRAAREAYPPRCAELSREAPEMLTTDALKAGDAQLIERMRLYETLYGIAPGTR